MNEGSSDSGLHFDGCFHGGQFFAAIGERFDRLDRRHSIINADVLDAWFPPSPRVITTLTQHLPWLLQTSPPTHGTGLIEVIAATRGVAPCHILPGAGSSDLIFLALREWLDSNSKVLVLDPMYSEYMHVLMNVIGCRIDRFPLHRDEQYQVDPNRLIDALRKGHYDGVVLVNPNSPTGRFLSSSDMKEILQSLPERTRAWIDETYIDYVDAGQSLEQWSTGTSQVVVCKSMSKVYALSGARAAYLCGPESLIAPLRRLTPPWAVSLPAQLAAVEALRHPEYYADAFEKTRVLRKQLTADLQSLGWDVVDGCANFVLAHLPDEQPETSELIAACQDRGLFLRDPKSMGTAFGNRAVRVAVKCAETQSRMMAILRDVLSQPNGDRAPLACSAKGVS